MDTTYYHIIDLNLVGKEEEYVPYIYNKDSGWEVDRKNILMDRVMGYDKDGIGGSDMMLRVEKITEEAAGMLMPERQDAKDQIFKID